MKIAEIMSKNVVSVDMDATLQMIKEIFDNHSFHHVLVVNNGVLAGIISDRDLLRALSPYINTAAETNRDIATLNKRAHQIMSRKPVTLTPESHISDVVKIFNTHYISCIPIVNESRKVLGIVSWRDIFKTLGTIKKQ